MKKQRDIMVQNKSISVMKIHDEDFISLTDMVKNFGDDAMIYQWM